MTATKTLNGQTVRDLHAIVKTLEASLDQLTKMTPATPTANDAKWDAVSAIRVGLDQARNAHREYLRSGE